MKIPERDTGESTEESTEERKLERERKENGKRTVRERNPVRIDEKDEDR